MRLAPLAALAALLAAPAFAQTQYADSTGGYLSVRSFGLTGVTGGLSLDGIVGYRFSGGTDVGLRVGTRAIGTGFHVGPTVGRTWHGPVGSRLRLEGTALYESADRAVGTPQDGYERFAHRDLSADVTATASRSLRLLGTLRTAPAVGVFGVAEQRLSLVAPATFRTGDATRAAAGVHVELPLSFRLFGATATVSGAARIALAHTGDDSVVDANLYRTYAGGGLRINF